MLSNPESGLLRWIHKKFQDQGTFALDALVSWLLLSLRCRQQTVRCLLKVRRRFLITKQYSGRWDMGLGCRVTSSYSYSNWEFWLWKSDTAFISRFHPLPSSSLETAGRKTVSSDTSDHWTRRTEQFLRGLFVVGGFFQKPLKVLKVLLIWLLSLSNPYLWGAREAQSTPKQRR